ncbi:MAG TPA: uL30 family ribosomal protein, partial [Jiangellaceae bacterium]
MSRLKVRQVRSAIGGTPSQRETLRSLGLKRIR